MNQHIPTIKVAVVDDNPTVREGLGILIDGTDGYRCVGKYPSCELFFKGLSQNVPDVVLMDISLVGMSGIEGVKRLKTLNPKVIPVMLTIYEDNVMILEALCAGAIGYLLKRTPPGQLLDAVREAFEGGSPMSTSIARKVVMLLQENNQVSVTQAADVVLEPRELQILHRLAEGATYEAIGYELFISVNTVKYHLRKIYLKLQADSKSEAIAKAIRMGLLK